MKIECFTLNMITMININLKRQDIVFLMEKSKDQSLILILISLSERRDHRAHSSSGMGFKRVVIYVSKV